jgi:hypothetical protein
MHSAGYAGLLCWHCSIYWLAVLAKQVFLPGYAAWLYQLCCFSGLDVLTLFAMLAGYDAFAGYYGWLCWQDV